MNTPAGENPLISWRQYLWLVEELLNQPDIDSQRALITKELEHHLHCEADIWLAEPYFPLPGEPDIKTLSSGYPPKIVLQAVKTHTIQNRHEKKPTGKYVLAAPMITRDNLLGVIQVSRSAEKPLTQDEIDYLEGVASHSAVALQIARQIILKNFRNEQLELVRSVSEQIANFTDIDSFCQQVTKSIQSTFDYYFVSIFTVDKASPDLKFRASSVSGDQEISGLSFTVEKGEGLVGYVAETGSEVIAADVRLEERYRYIDTLPETQSEAVIPLISDKDILGVLDIQSDRKNAFHEIDIMVLKALANTVALAIDGVNLYIDQQDKALKLEILFELSHTISSLLDLEELSEQIVSLLQKRLGYSFVEYYSYHPGRKKLFYEFGSGSRSQQLATMEISYDLDDPLGIIPWVARTLQPKIVNDVTNEPIYRPSELTPEYTHSELAIPILHTGELLGVLDIQSEKLNAFSESDITLIDPFAASVANAVKNATLYRSEKWRSQVAESMRDVAGMLSEYHEPEKLLDVILTELEKNLPCDSSAIWLVDENAESHHIGPEHLRLGAVHGVDPQILVDIRQRMPAVDEWMKLLLTSKEPSIREIDGLYGPLGLALNYAPDYSSLAAPLYSGEVPLGLLTIAHHTANRYGHEARAISTTFASYASVAIENARLYSEAQRNAWTSSVLLQVAENTRSLTSVSELLSAMVRLPPLLIGVKKSAFILWSEEYRAFIVQAAYGFEDDILNLALDTEKSSAFCKLMETRDIVNLEDSELCQLMPSSTQKGVECRGILIPLITRNTLIGGFLIGYEMEGKGENYQAQLLEVVKGIAYQTTVGLDNIRLAEAQEEEAFVTAVLLQAAQAVVSQNNLHDILETIVHLMPILIGVDTCIIYSWNDKQQLFTTDHAFAGSHELEKEIQKITFSTGEFKLLDAVKASHEMQYAIIDPYLSAVSDWKNAPCFPSNELDTGSIAHGVNLVTGFPLTAQGQFFGVLLAKEHVRSRLILARRVEIINGIAQQAALAIQNELLKLEMVQRERTEREIQLARQIQQTFLPDRLPEFKHWQLAARWQTALQVGGDFYDVIELDKHRLGLVIADVADKGMPAALYMTVTRTLIQALTSSSSSPAALLEQVNNILFSDKENGMFVTAFFAEVNLDTGEVKYANAGHNPPIIIHSDGSMIDIERGGIALGVLEGIKLKDQQVTLKHGDSLLLYTDGVTEATSNTEAMFGLDKFKSVLRDNAANTIDEMLTAVEQSLDEFRSGMPPSDDVTMLCIHRNRNTTKSQ